MRSAGGRGGAEDVGEGGISLSIAVTTATSGGRAVLRVIGSGPGVLMIVGHDGGGGRAGGRLAWEASRVVLLVRCRLEVDARCSLAPSLLS